MGVGHYRTTPWIKADPGDLRFNDHLWDLLAIYSWAFGINQ